MKNIFFIAAFFSLAAFKYVSDVLSDVGTTLDDVKIQTLIQIGDGEFNVPYYTNDIKTACMKLPVGVREATMPLLGKVIRDYVESSEFKTDYEAYLNDKYPTDGVFNPNDPKWEGIRKNKYDDLTQTFASISSGLLNAFIQAINGDIQANQSLLEMVNNGNGQNIPWVSKDELQKNIGDDKMLKDLYAKDKTEFEKKYAEIFAAREMRNAMMQEKNDVASTIQTNKNEIAERQDYKSRLKKELQSFLDASANIDFNAQLTTQNNHKVFVNSDYENKSDTWKFYFRCGKEAVTGARNFAQNWLSSLQ